MHPSLGAPIDSARAEDSRESGPDILDALDLPVLLLDLGCTLARFNQAATAVLGLSRADLGRPLSDLPLGIDLKEVVKLCTQVIADGGHYRRELRDGSRWFVLRIAAYHGTDRTVQGALITFTNVTAFRASLEQAVYEREYTKTILNTVGESLVILDTGLCIQTANRAFYTLLGVSRETTQGVPIYTLGDPEWRSCDLWGLLQKKLFKQIDTCELQCNVPSSLGRRTLLLDARWMSAGGTTSILVVIRDITERKVVEEALRASEERYRRLNELLPVAVYTCEAPSGVITYFNATAVRLWGRAPSLNDSNELFCGSHQIFVPDGTLLPHSECPMAIALREGRSFRNQEIVIARPDGSRVRALVNIDPIRDAAGGVVGAVNVLLDVSALKAVEEALREERNNLQTLLDTLPVAVFMSNDPESRRIYGNRAAAALLRMPVDAHLSSSGPPREQPTHFQLMRESESLESEKLALQRAALGEVVRDEAIDHLFDDGTLYHTLVSAQPLLDAAGRRRGAIASVLDITGLRRAENALRDADRHKDRFLATLAHELRNPLAPLRTALTILASCSDAESVKKTTRVMERQLNQLISLIDDLLDMSRIAQGKLHIRKTHVELAPAILQAIETIRPLADARHHTIRISMPEAPILLEADAVRLTQIFSNLLDNACKYTPEDSEIRVSVETGTGETVVTVHDSGIGIPRERLEDIFEMFSQVDSTERTPSGLGIGLSLAKQLVDLHGGTIIARSDGPGRGSEFVVRLPSLSADVLPSASPRADEVSARGSARRRVLVIDDNEDAANMLGTLLEMSGHEVEIAHDGPHAIERASTFKPQIIALDIGLPTMDGYEVCRALRKQPWGSEIVVVAITGWGQDEDRRKSSQAGFDAHLVKPIDPDALLKLIERFSERLDCTSTA